VIVAFLAEGVEINSAWLQKMEGARGLVNSDIILESTGPRLYSAVFKQYNTPMQVLGTSFVGSHKVSKRSYPGSHYKVVGDV